MSLPDADLVRLERRVELAQEAVTVAGLERDGTAEAEERYQTAKRKLAKIRKVWRTHRRRIQEGSPNGAVVARPSTLTVKGKGR